MMRTLVITIIAFAAAFAHAAEPKDVIESHGIRLKLDGVGKVMMPEVRAVIEEQLRLTKDEKVSAPLLDDFAFFVRQRYLQLGYPRAKVNWEIDGGRGLLHVEEDEPDKIGDIRFEGAGEVKEDDLRAYLLRQTKERLGSLGKTPPVVEADLQAGAGLVQRLLQSRGYLDATVDAPKLTPRADANVQDVLVQIHAGQLYKFGSVTLTGDLGDKQKEVREIIEETEGKPFNEVDVESLRGKLAKLYQASGHFAATVTAKTDRALHADGVVPVEFVVTSGPMFSISQVNVSPLLSKGAQRIVRASLKPSIGEDYRPSSLDVMNRRILDTEVFSRLDITPKPDGENTLALDITGEEAPRKRVAAYVGYQTFNGPIVGVEGRIVNFLGTGDTAGASVEYSGIGLAGSLKWINPAFVNSPWSLNVDLTAQSLEPFGYREETVGAHASFSRKWSRHATASVFTGIDSTKDTSGLLTLLELGPSDYRVAKAGASFTLDYRNSAVLPTKGWLFGGTLTDGFGVGGLDLNYLRTDLNFAFYQPITKRLRAAVQARVSALQSSADVADIPIDLRLFNGGATTVRSFAEHELGLEASDGTPLGGKVTHVFNAELSYEIVENLELATFVDAGNLVRDSNSIASLHDMRYAVGLGVRYKLPFGPLRVDYGFNPSRREGEKVGALHITFGFAF